MALPCWIPRVWDCNLRWKFVRGKGGLAKVTTLFCWPIALGGSKLFEKPRAPGKAKIATAFTFILFSCVVIDVDVDGDVCTLC